MSFPFPFIVLLKSFLLICLTAFFFFSDRSLGEKLMPFYEFCSVKKLSDCTDVQEITQMFKPCPELQLYMHRAVPVLQRYLYKDNPNIYQELQKQKISQRLAAMQFFKVRTFNIIVNILHLAMYSIYCFWWKGTVCCILILKFAKSIHEGSSFFEFLIIVHVFYR